MMTGATFDCPAIHTPICLTQCQTYTDAVNMGLTPDILRKVLNSDTSLPVILKADCAVTFGQTVSPEQQRAYDKTRATLIVGQFNLGGRPRVAPGFPIIQRARAKPRPASGRSVLTSRTEVSAITKSASISPVGTASAITALVTRIRASAATSSHISLRARPRSS